MTKTAKPRRAVPKKRATGKTTPTTTKTKVAPKRKKATTAKTSTKATAKKATSTATKRQAPARDLDIHGFVPGTDSSLIVQALLEGGADRTEVNERATALIKATNGLETRNGSEKAVASLVAGVLSRLKEKGYTIESTFRVVPPKAIEAEVKKDLAKRKRAATRAANKKK